MKPIKTAVASFGLSGQVFHAPFLDLHPGFDLVAIGERSKDLVRQRYPDVVRPASFEELISIREVELVVVNTPDVTHYDYCRMALLSDKHVVVEKPFVFTVKEAEELTALARKRNRLLTVYQNRRFDGDFRTVKQIRDPGRLGRIVEFESDFQRYRNFVVEGTWKERVDRRVGMTYNLGSHSLDQALVLFGMPEGLWATVDILRDGGCVDDYFHIVLLYPRLKVTLRAGYLMREQGPRFTLHGTAGSYMVYGIDPQEEELKAGALPGGEGWGSVPESQWGILNTDAGRTRYPTLAGDYRLYYDGIYRTLRGGDAPEVSHSQMTDLVRLLEACFESSETGRTVRF